MLNWKSLDIEQGKVLLHCSESQNYCKQFIIMCFFLKQLINSNVVSIKSADRSFG